MYMAVLLYEWYDLLWYMYAGASYKMATLTSLNDPLIPKDLLYDLRSFQDAFVFLVSLVGFKRMQIFPSQFCLANDTRDVGYRVHPRHEHPFFFCPNSDVDNVIYKISRPLLTWSEQWVLFSDESLFQLLVTYTSLEGSWDDVVLASKMRMTSATTVDAHIVDIVLMFLCHECIICMMRNGLVGRKKE